MTMDLSPPLDKQEGVAAAGLNHGERRKYSDAKDDAGAILR